MIAGKKKTERAAWKDGWLISECWLINASDYVVWIHVGESVQSGGTCESEREESTGSLLFTPTSPVHNIETSTNEESALSSLEQHSKDARSRACPHTHTHTHLLFPSLLPLVLRVLQHLLSPQVKEVGWVGVELQALLPIIPAGDQKNHIQLMSWWITTFYYGAKLKNIMVFVTQTFVKVKRQNSVN